MGIDLKRKNIMKITALTSMVIFTLFTVFSGTMAWFLSNQTYDNGGNNIQVGVIQSSISSITFHAQVGTKTVDGTNYYLFEAAPYASLTIGEKNTPSDLVFNPESGAYKDWEAKQEKDRKATLSTYSLLSQDQPLLILFHVIPYTADSPKKVVLDFKTESEYLGSAQSVTRDDNPLSSIVQFHSVGFTQANALPSGGAYESATRSYAATYRYGEVRGITYDKKWADVQSNASVNYDDDGVINIFSNLDGNGVPSSTVYTEIGVVMNFSIPSLEYIYNHFLGEEVLDDDIFFNWDWIMEV